MKKVLVIDDAAELADMVGITLEAQGFRPLVAFDGETGIELARKELPDLILCDVQMPRIDGYDTLKAVREHETTATTPFIFLSGRAERPDVRRGMELGADDYLTKPFTPAELVAAVRAQLAKKQEVERQTEKKLDEVRGNIRLALPHELRTPLTGILGLSAILVQEHDNITPPEILSMARDIEFSARRLQHLVENFLICTQLELMKEEGNQLLLSAAASRIPAAALVSRVAGQAARDAKREADLRCDVIPCTVAVIGENLEKIVSELVSNACKFSEAGTPVLVETSLDDSRFILTIADQGRGMTPDQIARIGPHIQFDRRMYEQQGAGLGLIIAKRLTELQGGRWAIQSTPGQGTTVTVSFPLAGSI